MRTSKTMYVIVITLQKCNLSCFSYFPYIMYFMAKVFSLVGWLGKRCSPEKIGGLEFRGYNSLNFFHLFVFLTNRKFSLCLAWFQATFSLLGVSATLLVSFAKLTISFLGIHLITSLCINVLQFLWSLTLKPQLMLLAITQLMLLARILRASAPIFRCSCTKISGNVAGIYWYYGTTSHAPEFTAKYYNTIFRDWYQATASMFSRHSMIFNFICSERRIGNKKEMQPDQLIHPYNSESRSPSCMGECSSKVWSTWTQPNH